MITRYALVGFYVTDQEEARRFYTEKMGFEVRHDVTMDDGFRWLTVGLPGQPDLEIGLMEPKPGPTLDEESARALRALVEKGAFGIGVLEVDDCRATYEELRRRGVEFVSPPEEKFYGVEAIGKDNSGNWFSMTEHRAAPASQP